MHGSKIQEYKNMVAVFLGGLFEPNWAINETTEPNYNKYLSLCSQFGFRLQNKGVCDSSTFNHASGCTELMTTVSQNDILSARKHSRGAHLLYIVCPFVSLAPPTRRSPGVTLSPSPLQCQSAVALIANHLVAVTAYTTVRWDNAGVHVWEGRLPIRRRWLWF